LRSRGSSAASVSGRRAAPSVRGRRQGEAQPTLAAEGLFAAQFLRAEIRQGQLVIPAYRVVSEERGVDGRRKDEHPFRAAGPRGAGEKRGAVRVRRGRAVAAR